MKKPTREEAIAWAQSKETPPSVLAWAPATLHEKIDTYYVIGTGEHYYGWFAFNEKPAVVVMLKSIERDLIKKFFDLDECKRTLKNLRNHNLYFFGKKLGTGKSLKIFEIKQTFTIESKILNE